MKIINEHFEVGQRYAGMVDGTVFLVADILANERLIHLGYTNELYHQRTNTPQICFVDERTGHQFWHDLEWAKRLLLKPI